MDKLVFYSYKFVTFEKYVEKYTSEDILRALTICFGGDGAFARLAIRASVEEKSVKAGKYYDALLLHWKKAEMEPSHLLKTKFPVTNPAKPTPWVTIISRQYRVVFYGDYHR